MSDPATPAAPASEPVVQPTPDPNTPPTEVDIPADGGFPAPEPEPVPAAAKTPEPPPEPPTVKKSPFQSRIDTLTAQRETERRRAEDAEKRAELFEAMAKGKPADPAADPNAQPVLSAVGLMPGSPEFKRAVQDEAVRLAAAETAKSRTDGLLKAGNTEYKDFTDRCNVVASLGAGDRPDFMQIVTDPEVIPDGHKIIAQLADNPDEAARILALPTVQMTAALVKFQAEASKVTPKPISAAPPPIKTIDGTARTDTEPKDSDDMATYAAKYKRIQEQKLKANAPSRFARH